MTFFSINMTIKDAKGQSSTTTLYTSDGGTLPFQAIINAGVAIATLAAQLVRGQIETLNICAEISLAGIGDNDALAHSDVEEGALFLWNVLGGYDARNRLATFDEVFVDPASRELVDNVDGDLVAFFDAIVQGVDVDDGAANTVTVQFTDARGADIIGSKAAYESFQSSRKR